MQPIIQIRGLVAGYQEKVIIDDLSLDIYQGKITVILGTSGCGKTTLLKNIVRLQTPFAGSIRLLGEETTTLDEKQFGELLLKVGMLFQNGALLNSLSVFDNVALPIEQHTHITPQIIEKNVRVKLALVELSHALHLFPSELSGGMRKRAALARAIALDPQILFADEPSAGLDPVTARGLDELLLNLKRQLKMSMVIVTHEVASINRIADRIIFLEKGKLLFEGTLEEAHQHTHPSLQAFFDVG